MKCSVCEKDFFRTIQVTIFEDLTPTKFMNSTTKMSSLKTMCMECFLRLSAITDHININDIPTVWFEKVNRDIE